ncbi:enoyl-CoA hydratase/isomerase family protein [Rhodoligotrophos defluvii]|uniref:enoyl-CoA hydratase/isomerase family protein n=1 Tax=Rhodoligotrophos defluvii TaxID=2561934 RepID=UPI0010C971CF|nr:enoyl-CoA hydratase-related protein [Rhodoligotrophos defluvii]
MAQPRIRRESSRGITSITFNRPEAMNGIDLAMAREMRILAHSICDDSSARVLVLRGAGNAFMAGGDVRAFADNLGQVQPFAREIISGFHAFIEALARAPQPVLASIHGAAAGAGLSLVAACDLVIAAQSTKLAFAYKGLGVSPDGGATFFLPRAVGAKRAAELLLVRDSFAADEARQIGLVNWVVPDEALEAETLRIAEKIAANSGTANRVTKRLLRRSPEMSLLQQLAAEEDGFVECAGHQDFSEGVGAFLNRRRPVFAQAIEAVP